jgi:hypothetical protein
MAGSYSKNGVTVQQGFQQYISKIVLVVPDDKAITTIVYPNPCE